MRTEHQPETQIHQDGQQRYLVSPRQTQTPRRAYRVKEVGEMLGLPRSTVYDLVRRKEFRAVFLGEGQRKIVLIPAEEIDRILSARRSVDPETLEEQIRRVTTIRTG